MSGREKEREMSGTNSDLSLCVSLTCSSVYACGYAVAYNKSCPKPYSYTEVQIFHTLSMCEGSHHVHYDIMLLYLYRKEIL